MQQQTVFEGSARRYTMTYRVGGPNYCPGCGGTQWHVGRQTAECAYCSTAMPLADPADRRPMTLMPRLRDAWRPFAGMGQAAST